MSAKIRMVSGTQTLARSAYQEMAQGMSDAIISLGFIHLLSTAIYGGTYGGQRTFGFGGPNNIPVSSVSIGNPQTRNKRVISPMRAMRKSIPKRFHCTRTKPRP